MRVYDDPVFNVLHVVIAHRDGNALADDTAPKTLNDLIVQLAFLALDHGALPVYSAAQYALPAPFFRMGDAHSDMPDRVVVG